jgi:hypothetical protein
VGCPYKTVSTYISPILSGRHVPKTYFAAIAAGFHLLQSSLVFINTQLLQAVLRDPAWAGRLTEEDRRGLSPLFWSHVNPYGRFRLDMDTRLDLTAA